MIEVWKDVIGYESYYEVSNFGTVKSKDRYITRIKEGRQQIVFYKERVLTTYVNPQGYCIVKLSSQFIKTTTTKIHILVCKAFSDNPNNYKSVNHKDFNKQNNHITNLEWVSNRENCTHRTSRYIKSSKYPGVSFNKANNKWAAVFNHMYKNVHLGLFEFEENAANAYVSYLAKNDIKNKYIF